MAFKNDIGTSAREKFKFFEDNTTYEGPANSTTPIGVLTGGIYNLSTPTYADGDAAVLQFTSSGLLKTDATVSIEGDINIGSVEIKDASSDTRVKVKDDGTDNAMVVTQNSLPALTAGDDIIGRVKLVDDDGNLVDVTGGRLHVEFEGANAVDVKSVLPGTEASQLGKAEDAAHASGDVGVMALAVRNDTLAALATTDGDYSPIQVDANGAMFVNTDAVSGVAPQANGIDVAGGDGYVTIVTASAIRHHLSYSIQGSNDAILSLDGGTTDSFYLPANSAGVFDNILIASSATVQGKNASGGQSYTNLTVTIW